MTAATVVPDAPPTAGRGRLEKAQVRRDLRSGALTLPQVVRERPGALRPLTLFALVLELPGFGCRRLSRLNGLAIADDINLAVTLGEASERALEWLVRQIASLDDVTVGPAPEEGDWRALAVALDELVLEHERSVRDESLPVDRWAFADERLHQGRARLMSQALTGSSS
jgi:hypothetical protein